MSAKFENRLSSTPKNMCQSTMTFGADQGQNIEHCEVKGDMDTSESKHGGLVPQLSFPMIPEKKSL